MPQGQSSRHAWCRGYTSADDASCGTSQRDESLRKCETYQLIYIKFSKTAAKLQKTTNYQL